MAAAGLRVIEPVMTISLLSAGRPGAGVASVVGVACAAAWFAASCCADKSIARRRRDLSERRSGDSSPMPLPSMRCRSAVRLPRDLPLSSCKTFLPGEGCRPSKNAVDRWTASGLRIRTAEVRVAIPTRGALTFVSSVWQLRHSPGGYPIGAPRPASVTS